MEVELGRIHEFWVIVEQTVLVELFKMRSLCANKAVSELVCGVGNRVEVGTELVVSVAINYAVVDFAVNGYGVGVTVGGVVV